MNPVVAEVVTAAIDAVMNQIDATANQPIIYFHLNVFIPCYWNNIVTLTYEAAAHAYWSIYFHDFRNHQVQWIYIIW